MANPPSSPTPQVFLSYSRTDLDACVALRTELEKAGLSVFKDDASIRAGDKWVSRLEDALQGCSAFVVLIGTAGVERWVGAEVQIALTRHLSPHGEDERLPIFPVLLGDTQPDSLPPLLGLFQSVRWLPPSPLPDTLLDALRARTSLFELRQPIEGCPFLGLNAFGRDDARLFFGRRREILEALACLGDQRETNPARLDGSGSGYHRWLQLEGNSGSGKSSLVMAGMLPMIELGALWARTGFPHWKVLGPMMPSKDPLAKLAEVLELGLVAEPAQRDSLALELRLQQDPRALARRLRDFKQEQTAFLLVVDQFEELFTFAEQSSRSTFDGLLAHALQDSECPLFLITTVRADFLDRFEQLPALQAIYNSRCKRYFLPVISAEGLREAIEQPARLARLDVSEVTGAILADARGEMGALPLVENALFTLWQQREPNSQRLSGELYRQKNGIAGMLSTEADALLERIDRTVPKGKRAALELLLSLTRINDEGRHSRQRITREEAVDVAGEGRDVVGERVVRMLSGERPADAAAAAHHGALRLITAQTEGRQSYVDLIHETLIRARGKDEKTGQLYGYWPTLYDYIEANRDRDLHRQQLKRQAEQWRHSRGFGRWWNLAGWGDRRRYSSLRIRQGSPEGQFLAWSRWIARLQTALLVALLGVWGESAWWATRNSLPFGYVFIKPLWALGLYRPLPELVEIPAGTFEMGCKEGRDDTEGKGTCNSHEQPPHPVTFTQPFMMGTHEVTFLEYDYSVWDRQRRGDRKVYYPSDSPYGRFDRPVIDVSWHEAQAYLAWLREATGDPGYRLPSEAEWEYASRGGNGDDAYWWGERFDVSRANCRADGSEFGNRSTAPVGHYPANYWGLFDTAGNVSEWVQDAFHDSYSGAPKDGSVWEGVPASHSVLRGKFLIATNELDDGVTPIESPRVVRGGSWFRDPWGCRAAYRHPSRPDSRGTDVGFRVCCGAPID